MKPNNTVYDRYAKNRFSLIYTYFPLADADANQFEDGYLTSNLANLYLE